MSLSLVVLVQVLIMFLLMCVGVISYKTKLIDDHAADQMVHILLYVVNVGLIINAYNTKYKPELARGLVIAMGLAVVTHIVGIVISKIFWWKKELSQNSVYRYGVIYSNCGFMALPLISAVFPEHGVFYSSAYIIVFNLFNWTQGVLMMNPKTTPKESLKKLINPVVIAIIVGTPVFFLQIPIPYLLGQVFYYIAQLNTPLAMLLAGVFVIRSDILSAFKSVRVYLVSFLRLLLIPMVMIFVLKVLHIDETVAVTVLIAAACPSATTTMLFASKFGADESIAAKIFVLTTLLCIVTIPFVVWLYGVTPI